MIIKAKSYFATPFFMDVRKIAGSCCACPRMTTKTQGTCSRYARRKHRASAKVLAAAGELSRASPCQAGSSLRYTKFLRTSESEANSKKQGENFLSNGLVKKQPTSLFYLQHLRKPYASQEATAITASLGS